MSDREIQFITVAGRDIPAYLAICTQCKTLDLNTTFSPGEDLRSLVAECPAGHTWNIPESALAEN